MKMKVAMFLALVVSMAALGQNRVIPPKNSTATYRNANGRIVGTASNDGKVVRWRNPNGRITTTATVHGNVVKLRNPNGRIMATATMDSGRVGR